nr:hypothetical protein CFP56_71923 [Quercus suber]
MRLYRYACLQLGHADCQPVCVVYTALVTPAFTRMGDATAAGFDPMQHPLMILSSRLDSLPQVVVSSSLLMQLEYFSELYYVSQANKASDEGQTNIVRAICTLVVGIEAMMAFKAVEKYRASLVCAPKLDFVRLESVCEEIVLRVLEFSVWHIAQMILFWPDDGRSRRLPHAVQKHTDATEAIVCRFALLRGFLGIRMDNEWLLPDHKMRPLILICSLEQIHFDYPKDRSELSPGHAANYDLYSGTDAGVTTVTITTGKRLHRLHCSQCHLFPESNILRVNPSILASTMTFLNLTAVVLPLLSLAAAIVVGALLRSNLAITRTLQSYLKFAYGSFLKPHTKNGHGNQQDALEGFYEYQADAYDTTRTSLLRGRDDMIKLVAAQLKCRKYDSKPIWVDVGSWVQLSLTRASLIGT